jgi:zinc resistance-associated protein
MWKPLVATTAVLAIAGFSIVYAQQGDDRDGGARFEHRQRQLSPEDRAAFLDARIAALKAGLELTPDQAKNWPMFEQALRDMAQLRAQLRAAREARRENPTPTTPFERMARRADNMAKKSAALKHIADAGAPLYQSLDEAQKERFKKLARMLRPHHHHMRESAPWQPGWRDGRG